MGKTIITYLIEGKANGAQYMYIKNSTCKMFMIPRANLAIIKDRKELKSPSLYILFRENDGGLLPKAYIGETENFEERIKDHDNNKKFWQRALVFVSKDDEITKADVQYLEHLAISVALDAKRYSLDLNKQNPKAPSLPEHQKDSTDEFFDNVKTLTAFGGCPIFDKVEQMDHHLFYSKSRGPTQKVFTANRDLPS